MKGDYKESERRKVERRSGMDRRINPKGAYNGPERRQQERRGGKERRRMIVKG